ncbi:hypothetical protein BXZ70DRAFT_86907 [Cristinia sonorae]|uniref:Uncharacterized protein n=1 Tax=Cristinia sonorae TaxID=1940300 RepID=A0A8K0XR22_9AGAR|nr:hypothetical protein BXZ70DRAFT_86907 [Cristinia sonorae]
MDLSDTIALLNIALSLELNHILPQIFYIVSQATDRVLATGYTDKDGTHWELSRDKLSRVMAGRKRCIICAKQSILKTMLSPLCESKEGCLMRLKNRRDGTLSFLHEDTASLMGAAWIEPIGLCAPCTRLHTDICNEERRKCWERLAHIFGLVLEVVRPVSSRQVDNE